MTETLPPSPHMDPEGLHCFQTALATSRCYLEYGSGGSTIYANNIAKVKNIISIESDRSWAENVAKSLDKNGSKVFISYCDIGDVGDWGAPKSRERMENFWRYATNPWEAARQHNLVPDTVLIDGRFRVASFLYSLLSSRVGTTLLFDDYLDRPEYHIVEKFCRIESLHGRLALFRTNHSYSAADLSATFARFSVIPA
ncbi:MAG: hypothetical protein IT550_15000 [Novosphingobium sp.]|nr:hypothetical protein [Novosphingobium sp.]